MEHPGPYEYVDETIHYLQAPSAAHRVQLDLGPVRFPQQLNYESWGFMIGRFGRCSTRSSPRYGWNMLKPCSKAGETEDRFLNHNISQPITARPATLPQNLPRERHLRFKSPRWSQSSWRRLEAVGMGSAVLGKGTCWTWSKTLKSYLIHISDTCFFCNHKGILFWMKSKEQSVAWEWGLIHVRRSLSLGMMCRVHNIPWPWIGFGLVSVTVRQDHSQKVLE